MYTLFFRGPLLALVLLTIGSWTLTVYQARTMDVAMGIAARSGVSGDAMGGMSGMAMSGVTGTGWSVSGALTFLGVWTVMMAAMMFPAVRVQLFNTKAALSDGKRNEDVHV